VYLMVFQHVPVERCQQLVADVTGAQVSVGFVHGMVAECGNAVAEATKVIGGADHPGARGRPG
jgi:hypothetical protein